MEMLAEEDCLEIANAALAQVRPSLHARCLALSDTTSGRSVLAMLDQILVSAANFLLLVAVARSVATAETGRYVLALRAVDFITEIQNVFLWAPYTLFAPEREGNNRRTYAGSVLIHQLAACLATVTLMGAFAWGAFCLHADSAGLIALCAMAASPGIHAREFTRRICFANLDLWTAFSMDGSVLVLQTIGIATLYSTHRLSAWSVLLVTSVSCGLGALACLASLRNRFAVLRADIMPSFKENFSYGRWLLGSDLALLISNQLYPWFLSFFSGPASVALFAASQALTNFARMFLIGAQNVLLPSSARAFASRNWTDLCDMVKRSTVVLGSGAGLFSLLCLVAGGPALRLIYGRTFASSGLLVFALSLSILTSAVTLAPTFALAAARRADVNLRINAITLTFHVIAGLILTFFYHAQGAAYSLALGGLLAAALRWRVYRTLIGSRKEIAS
jgi:O-antigen/teichoic acid export membrane protein